MTFTKETDCSAINIFDEELTTFYDAGAPSTTTIVVTVTYTCADSSTEIVIDQTGDLAYADGVASLVITPGLLSQTGSALNDGIYHIKLTVDYDAGTHYDDEVCAAILCDTECDILEYQASNLTSNIYPFYQILDWTNTCDSCECTHACTIFNYLQEILSGDAETSDPCNCN